MSPVDSQGGEAQTVWSRRRVREENGLPSPWCFDGLAMGLIGYTVNGKRLYLGRAAFCEWMRRRVDV